MKYSHFDIGLLREGFAMKYRQKTFPAGENGTIYLTIEDALNDFVEGQTLKCHKKSKCKCSSPRACLQFFPPKKSDRMFASKKQLSQLLYHKSDKDSFYPGFIRLCCLFLGIELIQPVQDEQEISTHAFASKPFTQSHAASPPEPLLGTWKYTCTSFDKSYQHGGEFVINKLPDGKMKLSGFRMWRGTKNDKTKQWERTYYDESEYTQWRSVFILMIDDHHFAFEYEVPQKVGVLMGYCKCAFISLSDEKLKVMGDFYELNSPVTGQIVFEKKQ
jgi:hypothetical protein